MVAQMSAQSRSALMQLRTWVTIGEVGGLQAPPARKGTVAAGNGSELVE